VSRLDGSICRMNSRQRPQGGRTHSRPPSSRQTATMRLIRYSRAVTMDATAACSAQNPVPDAVSIQTPPYSLPESVTRTEEATSPKSRPSTRCGCNNPAARSTRSESRSSSSTRAAYPALVPGPARPASNAAAPLRDGGLNRSVSWTARESRVVGGRPSPARACRRVIPCERRRLGAGPLPGRDSVAG